VQGCALILTQPIVAIDTREQRPYRFPRSEVQTLPTGDYSIVGLEDHVVIERKTKSDVFGSLGRGRDRFEREFQRMVGLDYAAIVIEASFDDLLHAPAYSRMSPSAVINSLLGWSVKYRVPVFFAGDRRHGNTMTQRLLEKFWRYYHEGGGHAAHA
jgi:ERCC4-type nuclease